jgi:hypothetical protein
VWMTLGLVVLSQGGVLALESLFVPSEVRSPRHPLSELALRIGRWTGHEAAVDQKIFAGLGADDVINRSYENSAGGVVTVHCATWILATVSTPHPPDLCYSSNGWELLESHTVVLPDRPGARIAIQKYGWSGQRVVVAYWYQLDDRTYLDRDGERLAWRSLWGKKWWPPLTKTLLQTNESEQAEARLLEIALPIYDFHCKR